MNNIMCHRVSAEFRMQLGRDLEDYSMKPGAQKRELSCQEPRWCPNPLNLEQHKWLDLILPQQGLPVL